MNRDEEIERIIRLVHDKADDHVLRECIGEALDVAADEIEQENGTLRAGTALLDRMQETRIFVLPDGGKGVICGGRFDGWLCWRHPDGQFVTITKLDAEKPKPLLMQ